MITLEVKSYKKAFPREFCATDQVCRLKKKKKKKKTRGRRGQGGGAGITRAITRLETLVMRARYNIKCFFSLILSFGHKREIFI